VIALRATDRIGKGVRSPARDAVIADATPAEIRGKAFGFHRAMDHAGAVIGPVVGWLLISQAKMQPTQVIQWSVVPGIIAVLAVLFAMKKAGREREERPESNTQRPTDTSKPSSVGRSTLDVGSSLLSYLIVLFWLVKFPETLFLLRMQDLGLPVALTPLLWAALHVIRSTGTYPGGRLSDRFGPAPTMLGGWVVYGVVCVGLATARSAGVAAAWFLIFGVVAALTDGPERAFVSNLKSRAGTGSRFGVYYASIGLGALVGGLLFGVLYSRSGAPLALMVSAIGAAALVVVGFSAGALRREGGRGKREA
jgi:MFS family permease